MLSNPVDLANFLLDLVLIAIGGWLAVSASALKLRGRLGTAMMNVTLGAVILGVAHLAETVLDQQFHVGVAHNELVHRLLIVVGFVLIAHGLSRLTRAIRAGQDRGGA
ncbi:hypothetical protein ACLIJR_01955 [Hydrogenophaga sp. XSHU_21]|jgi:hypothetical protein